MEIIRWVFITIGIIIFAFLGLLWQTSIREREKQAIVISLFMLIFFSLGWLGYYRLFKYSIPLLLIPEILWLVFIILFYLPLKRQKPLVVREPAEQVDERDTMFAREEYLPGSGKYYWYYSLRPENKKYMI